jgi:hypothetical protein
LVTGRGSADRRGADGRRCHAAVNKHVACAKQGSAGREAGEGSAGVRLEGSGGVGSRRERCRKLWWRRDLSGFGPNGCPCEPGEGRQVEVGLSIRPAWASAKQRVVRAWSDRLAGAFAGGGGFGRGVRPAMNATAAYACDSERVPAG